MATDPVFGTTLLEEGTAQAELLVNEMLARIIAGSVRVLSKGDNTPPGSPDNFDAYIIGDTPTDDWDGQTEGTIAVYVDGWKFITPVEGLRCRVADEDYITEYGGTFWSAAIQTLTDAADIAWNLEKGKVAEVTLGGDRNMALPTGLVEGAVCILHVIQDGTPPRLLTWDAAFKWPGGTAPTLTNAAAAIDVFQFVIRGGALYGTTLGLAYA